MFSPTPILCTDFYKECHYDQYDPSIIFLTSYLTPRMSRTSDDKLVMFGLQYFVKSFLMEDFNRNFFNKSKREAVSKYSRLMKYTMGDRFADTKRWEKLHDLGYLPLKISAVPEGTRIPMKCPMIEITNTHSGFAWLVNFIETAMSCTLWHTMTSANVGYKYRQIVNKYYDLTVEDTVPKSSAIGDFSMRGQESIESASKSSAAFLLSFTKTATIPAIEFLEEYYNVDIEKEMIATGLASTEHSVMCSSALIDGYEEDMVKRLLTKIYPNDNFTMVSDSYDYWNMVSNIIAKPEIKELIMNHNGFIGIRPDSGTPWKIICGDPEESVGSPEYKGSVEILWDIFGGTINSKGYKVLDSHVRLVYGDSITPERAEEIYQKLMEKGFASNNVMLGMGSYSLQSAEGNTPLTRDTYSIAVKSTHCEIKKSPFDITQEIQIYKNPKTDDGHFKKSQKGLCMVYYDENGEITYKDGLNYMDKIEEAEDDLLEDVFVNGKLFRNESLSEIRNQLHGGNF